MAREVLGMSEGEIMHSSVKIIDTRLREKIDYADEETCIDNIPGF